MLRRYVIARFAPKHSPEKEQRLLSFATIPNPDDDSTPDVLESPGSPPTSTDANVTLSDRQKYHDAIFQAVQPGQQQEVIREYRPVIEQRIGTLGELKTDDELQAVIELARESIIQELNREDADHQVLAKAIIQLDSSDSTTQEISDFFDNHQHLIERYFKVPPEYKQRNALDLLQALLNEDMDRVRKAAIKKEPGITWDFMNGNDFIALYRKLRKVGENEDVRTPSAFTHEGKMHINADHEDFSKEIIGPDLAERAIIHEATHIAIERADGKFNLGAWTRTLTSYPQWNELKEGVQAVFRTDKEYIGEGQRINNERIVNEALAIYVAHTRQRVDAADRSDSQSSIVQQDRVHAIMQDIFDNAHSGFLSTMQKQLFSTVDRYTEPVERRDGTTISRTPLKNLLLKAVDERRENAVLNKHAMDPIQYKLSTNADEAITLAKNELAEEGKKNEDITPESLISSIDACSTKLADIQKRYPETMEKVIGKIPEPAEQKTMKAIFSQNIEQFSQQNNDLLLMKRNADFIARWDLPLEEGGVSVAEKREFIRRNDLPYNPYASVHLKDSDRAAVVAADKACKPQLATVLDVIKECADGYTVMTDNLEKAINEGAEFSKGADEKEGASVWKWMKKNIFSSQGQIVWITPLNIMNMYKIYKDAIKQNYESNQKVKENKFAKNLNFYKPIQHTLNKLARSTNNTESSEFKEYIEKDGFTFDDVFGKDGKGLHTGLLYQNRHNFNRAKAVLEYAADHGWLYYLDRLHGGHDVYGIDFIAEEGQQSFEELVQQHESGKKKQQDIGYSKVDKDADVPPIIDALMHELEQKNIFAVQGIMQRLQEKAKYSHSNTWMLTTLLMSMRDKPELRVCFDKGMIDNICNFTISQSAWSVTWLKVLRNELMDWKDGKDKFDNNTLTKTMVKIESRLKEEGVVFDENTDDGIKAKHEAIGIILSGKTYKFGTHRVLKKYEPRNPISIFESIFDDYRKNFRDTTQATQTDPSSTDDDFFNPENGGSDILLLGAIQTKRMIKRESQGSFSPASETKARGFYAQAYDRYGELKKAGLTSALENYQKEMKAKIQDWYATDVVGNNSSIKQFAADRDKNGRLIHATLLDAGFITLEQFNHIRNEYKTQNKVDPPVINEKTDTPYKQNS